MTASRTLYAALSLPEAGAPSPTPGLEAAAAVLAAHDARSDGAPLRNPRKASVHGGSLSLRATAEDGRLLFEVFGPDGAPVGQGPCMPRDRVAVAVLAEAVAAVLRGSDSGSVEWAAPGAMIDRTEFLSLHAYVSPRRRGRTATPTLAPDAAQAAAMEDGPIGRLLARQMRARSPLEARLGAAGWALTALLATVSLPVAALVSVVGLARGMDFRMTAQALIVTLLVMALMKVWAGIAGAAPLLP
ncbi:hypothetical protein [Citreimonas sp.]|uniref:hypothetical protein n=1 Tax=Citreimonas sp. TaxID=3036715 RepID=UPI0035C795C8